MSYELSEKDAQIVDQHQLKTRFIEECKQLPFDYLEPFEKELAEKCINKENFTDEELSQLKKLLSNYRPYFNEYNIPSIEKNVEQNLKVIKTSDELLRLLNDPNRYRIDMNYTVGEETVRLQLKLKQIPDSDYISLLDAQTRIFRNLNDSEKRVFAKASNNQQLTPEEMNMQKQIQDKINEKTLDFTSNAQDITEILAKTVDFVDDPEKPYHEKLAFWKQVDLASRVLLFNKIRQKLNISDKTEEDLFPTIR